MVFIHITVLFLGMFSSSYIQCALLGRNCESPGEDYVFKECIHYTGKTLYLKCDPGGQFLYQTNYLIFLSRMGGM